MGNPPKTPYPYPFSLLLLSMALYGMKYLWLVGVTCPVVSPPSISHTPESIPWSGRVRSRDGLDAVQMLLTKSQNIIVLSGLIWSKI